MSETEILTTLIGEFVSVEIDFVERVAYCRDKKTMNTFTIYMKNGKRYILKIKEIVSCCY